MCEKADKIRAARIELINAMRNNLPPECAEIIDRIESDDKGHFLSWSMDNPQQVSYAAKSEHQYDPVKRMRTSLGRYLGRQYGVEITPTINSAIERIFGEIAYDDTRFRVRDDVCEVYRNVGSSCMTDMDCVEFYENNGVRVVCYTPPGESKPIARALLWQTDKGEYLDRIYPNSGSHIEHYVKWAADRGCMIRSNHSMGGSNPSLTVKLRTIGPMPYLDTICHLSGRTLTTNGRGLVCHSTDGDEPTECRNCSEWCFEVDNGGYCEDCQNNLCSCERCGDRVEDTTEIEGQSVCEGCAENASCCDRCSETVWETSHIDGQDVCSGCAENASCCDRCSEPYFAEDSDLPLFDSRELCDCCHRDAQEAAAQEAAALQTV